MRSGAGLRRPGLFRGGAEPTADLAAIVADIPDAPTVQTVGAGGQQSVSWSSLNGGADRAWRFRIYGRCLDGSNLTVWINGSPTGVKQHLINQNNGGAPTVSATQIGFSRPTLDLVMDFSALLTIAGQSARTFRGHISSAGASSANWQQQLFTGAWYSAANITDVTVLASVEATFLEGLKYSMERVRTW